MSTCFYNGQIAAKRNYHQLTKEPREEAHPKPMATTFADKKKSISFELDNHQAAEAMLSPQASDPAFWLSAAPKRAADGRADDWKQWMRHLQSRRSPKSLEKLCRTKETPIGWGIVRENLSPSAERLLDCLDGLDGLDGLSRKRQAGETLEESLACWLEGTLDHPQTVDYALACLTVAHMLPRVAEKIPAPMWWQLLDDLWQVIRATGDWSAEENSSAEEALAQQLLTGELPLTLAYLFPEIKPLSKLRTAAREKLSDGLSERLNGEGLLQGCHLAVMLPLAACWTRCRLMGEQLKKGCWNGKAESNYQWFLRQALRLTAADGKPLLQSRYHSAWSPDFLQTAVALGGDESDHAAACALLDKKTAAGLGKPKNIELPETSDHCEWAGVAIMRTAWDRKAPAVVIDYSARELKIEVASGKQRLFSGVWSSTTTVDGKPLKLVGEWDEVCWFSDNDVDFLELSIELSGGARLERQILLAREDHFLLLADYLLDTPGGQLKHTSRLPLEGTIKLVPEKETREALLVAAKPVARVFPLALPEWRVDPRIGELTASDGHLQWTQQALGTNMAAPVFIDLDRRRLAKQCTWRQLTVAQSLETQPADVAVGYRVQCAKQQWLVYRSLAPKANRTLLGYNLSSECLVARFLAPSGEVDELMEIEG